MPKVESSLSALGGSGKRRWGLTAANGRAIGQRPSADESCPTTLQCSHKKLQRVRSRQCNLNRPDWNRGQQILSLERGSHNAVAIIAPDEPR